VGEPGRREKIDNGSLVLQIMQPLSITDIGRPSLCFQQARVAVREVPRRHARATVIDSRLPLDSRMLVEQRELVSSGSKSREHASQVGFDSTDETAECRGN
jgi:hypothetical protein